MATLTCSSLKFVLQGIPLSTGENIISTPALAKLGITTILGPSGLLLMFREKVIYSCLAHKETGLFYYPSVDPKY